MKKNKINGGRDAGLPSGDPQKYLLIRVNNFNSFTLKDNKRRYRI